MRLFIYLFIYFFVFLSFVLVVAFKDEVFFYEVLKPTRPSLLKTIAK